MIARLRRLALYTAAHLLVYADDEHHYVIVCEDCQRAGNALSYAKAFRYGVQQGFQMARNPFRPSERVGEA